MARIRTIKPAFWTDEKLSQLHPLVRMTFLGLISAMADDEGRCKADPRLVKAAVWPLDDEITRETVVDHVAALERVGRIQCYEHEGASYVQILNWKRHQRIDKPRPSELPPPPDRAAPLPIPVVEASENAPGVLGARAEGNGRDRKGSGAEETDRAAVQEISTEAPPPPRVVLPPKADRFLDMFYPARGEAERERHLNVKRQLYDVLDPQHPGPKIRGGTRVKARSAEHLEQCMAEVMKDPPMDRDMAIVFLLKKLTNPPKGPTPAEIKSDELKAQNAAEERYHAAMKSAGIQWAKDNPAEFERIRAEVDAQFRHAGGSLVGKLAKESALAQRCGTAAGFPDFNTWNGGRAA